MSLSHCIFDTEFEALDYDEAALAAWLLSHDDPDYKATTTKWDVPRQRIDGKWVILACPDYNNSGQTLQVDPEDGSWFPLPEE